MEALEVLVKGTKEYIVVEVTDTLNNLTTLGASSPTYDVVTDDDDETLVVDGATAITEGMLALCMIDTTPVDFDEGKYKLFLKFEALPEVPRLGPFRFRVDD